MANMINCPYCGKLSDPKLESCPHCGGQLQRTRPMAQVAPPPNRARQTCPNCHALVQEGDIICVACGTNLLTGQLISPEKNSAPKKRRSAAFPTAYAVGGGAAALLIVLVVGVWIFLVTRDPVRQAERLGEEQKYIEAIDVLQPYVEKVADDERAMIVMGQLLVEVSRFREAADAFEQAVRLNPSNSDAALWAGGSVAAASGAEARPRQVELLERVVESEPDNIEAWYLLALARGSVHDVTGQVEALEHVVSMRPTEEFARLSMGVALALEGELGQAQEELAIVGSNGSQREGDLQAVRGLIASLQDDDAEAIGALRASVESAEPTAIRFQALSELGRLLIQDGRFAEAEPYLRQAMALRPRDQRAQFLLGLVLAGRGNNQEALSQFTEVARSGGDFAVDAAVQEATIYLAMGSPERAADSLQRAAADPSRQSAAYLTVKGRVSAAQDDMTTAQDSYRRAINADPLYAPAYLENGLLYVKNAQLLEGMRELERYLDLVGADANSPEVNQVRELVTQLRQTTGQTAPSGA